MLKKLFVVGVLACITATAVMAQGIGLQIADTAVPLAIGQARVTGGFVVADEVAFIGGRAALGLSEAVGVFADVGMLDVDGADSGPALQGGLTFAIPAAVPVDLSVRGTLFSAFIEDVDVFGFSIAGVMSGDLGQIVPGMSVFGAVGLVYTSWEIDVEIPNLEINGLVILEGSTESFSEDETDPLISGGVLFEFNEVFSVYAEISHIDDILFGAGARLNL